MTFSALLAASAVAFPPLLAETPAISWAVVGFCIILGLMVTLGPSRRTTEIKNPYDE
jgi:hypothetical protein